MSRACIPPVSSQPTYPQPTSPQPTSPQPCPMSPLAHQEFPKFLVAYLRAGDNLLVIPGGRPAASPASVLLAGRLADVVRRHPEVAAKRPSKDARPGPSPFEARFARNSG